jgi:hypothetical protein
VVSLWLTVAVSVYCPVEYTTLGYFPNKGVNIFVAAAYGFAAVLALSLGIWKRTWSYSIPVAAGCALECVGESPLAPYFPFSPKHSRTS